MKIATQLGCAVLALTVPQLAAADNRMDIGGFAGVHLFNDNNELGVSDGDDANHLNNALIFGVRLGASLTRAISMEGELGIAPTESDEGGEDVVALAWRANALYHFGDGKVRPFALIGAGGSTSASNQKRFIGSETDFVAHGGVGVKWAAQTNWGLRFDARLLAPPSSDSDGVTIDGEFLVGLYKVFPTEAKPAPARIPQPEPPSDRDGDGVIDEHDGCPDEPEDIDGNADDDGCPETEDKDGDKVTDDKDQCIDEQEDPDGFADEDGCPDPDNDNDGVLDAADKCPDQAETQNGYQDDDGCSDEVPAAVSKFTGTIEGIRFANGRAKIRPVSFKVLNQAAAVLKEHSSVGLKIVGHTDNSGSIERNKTLSQQRADAVKAYLVAKGIDESRLQALGVGPDDPIADNGTRAGQAQNRRVEFVLRP